MRHRSATGVAATEIACPTGAKLAALGSANVLGDAAELCPFS